MDDVILAYFSIEAETEDVKVSVHIAGNPDVVRVAPGVDQLVLIVEIRVIAFQKYLKGEVLVQPAGGLGCDVETYLRGKCVDFSDGLVFVGLAEEFCETRHDERRQQRDDCDSDDHFEKREAAASSFSELV